MQVRMQPAGVAANAEENERWAALEVSLWTAARRCNLVDLDTHSLHGPGG